MNSNTDIATGRRLGTTWTAPGEGSTVRDLITAYAESRPLGSYTREVAGFHLTKRTEENLTRKTNLLLTGETVTEYDCRRIAEAVKL